MIRKIGEQYVAVPTGRLTSEIHGMIALSESGELLWKELEKGATVEELSKKLTECYDVEPSIAFIDAEKFISGLKEQGAIQ